MTDNIAKAPKLHPRNKHLSGYNFDALIKVNPDLAEFVFINKYGNQTIDFALPRAVKLLNQALLILHYKIDFWDIPEQYLCPAVPGRADYIHYLYDLLRVSLGEEHAKGKKVKVLDIGVGANCIYPIIGIAEYAWQFIGAEIDELAFKTAKSLAKTNRLLQNHLKLKQQKSDGILAGILCSNDELTIAMCNPPFHASAEEATQGSQRKVNNLAKHKTNAAQYDKPVLNFSGQDHELWCPGGELAFLTQYIKESGRFKQQVIWFTSLVSKKENLNTLYTLLKKQNVVLHKTINMTQGNKVSRILVWTYQDIADFELIP